MSRKFLQRVRSRQRGASLIEVLVSMVILMLGLLGLIGVMIESQRAQLESYQRVQALLLAQDMVSRINGNRAAADCYQQAAALGTGNGAVPVPTACSFANGTPQYERVEQDLAEWKSLLLGAVERTAGGDNIGAMIGARGCITKDGTGTFLVTVAWQGNQTLGGPPAALTCGQGSYGDEALRRAVGLTVIPPNAS